MQAPELCCNCRSPNVCETGSMSSAIMLLKAVGYCSFCCKDCGFKWGKFSPMDTLLNMIYLLLALEIGFLLLSVT